MRERSEAVEVEGGAVPTAVLEPDGGASGAPALVVVPSIFGPAPDLLERLSPFADDARVAVPDPFWRQGAGVIPYEDREAAFARLRGFEPARCLADLRAVVAWARAHGSDRVVGLGICFGGPFVMRLAADGLLDGVVTWHGSRMEQHLEGAERIRVPLRLHFGGADPVTPPEAIEAVRGALAGHPDCAIVVHPGADHGFSHDGPAFDAKACQAGLDAVGELLARARRPG
ncbi:MAG: dienelactone hydrolase family protein [Myxococcota bacterium]|nr:dienelactone hydrolase family protein [Myxococcota bacterium]